MGYSSWGCKPLDTTERLSTAHGHDKNGRHLGVTRFYGNFGSLDQVASELAADLEAHSEPTLTLP